MPDLRVYAARLAKASLREILHRTSEQTRLLLLKKLPGLFGPKPPVFDRPEGRLIELVLPEWQGVVSAETVDWILAGGRFCLGADPEQIKEFENQVRDTFFCDISTANKLVDIRSVWEPARLQHVTLLLAVLRQGQAKDRFKAIQKKVQSEILEWIKKYPFPFGPHYISAMECGLRIPVFVAALKLVDFSKKQKEQVLASIYKQAWLIRRRLSLYASLGNHTVCECLGLVFAGALFQDQGEDWLQKGSGLLKQEFFHQILPDGGPAEQSLAYHRFVLDVYFLVQDFAQKNSLFDVQGWDERLRQGERFQQAMQPQGAGLQSPNIGDSDDGNALAPGLRPIRPEVQPDWNRLGDLKYLIFPKTGYTVIKGKNGPFLCFAHGPLGLAPLYNHGHADALSVIISLGGIPFLIDPGTYSYNMDPALRRYFKGTRAHNTVTLDGLDQARQLTGNIWKSSYSVQFDCQEQNSSLILQASHNGYFRKKNGVIHERRLAVASESEIRVTDSFSGSGWHEFALNFHLHPAVQVQEKGSALMLSCGEHNLQIHCEQKTFQQIRGQNEPILGWFSPSYGRLEPTTTLQIVASGRPEAFRFQTILEACDM